MEARLPSIIADDVPLTTEKKRNRYADRFKRTVVYFCGIISFYLCGLMGILFVNNTIKPFSDGNAVPWLIYFIYPFSLSMFVCAYAFLICSCYALTTWLLGGFFNLKD